MAQLDMKGKIAWVTGSGRGIGRAIAIALANHGAQVVLSARTVSEIEAVASEITELGGQALAMPCDVRHADQVRRLVVAVQRTYGEIDVLVNNAGVAVFDKIADTSEGDWDAMMDTNLKGAFLCTQTVLPSMVERQTGHIINIVSVAGKTPYYKCGGYCASKFGLLGFTEVLRMETRKYGVRVSSLMPGATDTFIWGDAEVDHSRMMPAEQIAESVLTILHAGESATVEELVIRPKGGDV
jgi:3-oxoacyl-[acyl-carrier protein] reductase